MKNLVDHPEFLTNPKSALKTVFLNINDQIKEILKETPQYKVKYIFSFNNNIQHLKNFILFFPQFALF